MSWETIELTNCVSILSGFAFKSKLFNDKGKGLPIIRIRDVTRGYSETFYDGEYAEKYLIQDGDYLIGMDGEFNISSWQGGTALLNQRVCKIDEIDEKILDRSYLAYFLSSELKKIEDITPFVTVKHLSVKTLKAIEIPLPPLGEQRRIAAVLDKADALRQKRRAALAKLDTLLQATFLHMFGDPVTNPMGWDVVEFSEAPIRIIDGDRGKNYPKSDEFLESGYCLFLSTKNVSKRGFIFEDCQFISKEKDQVLRKGKLKRHDVVLTTRGTVGNTAYYDENVLFEHIRINSGMVILRTIDNNLLPQFLEFYISADGFKNQVERLRSGTAQPQLPIGTLKKVKLPLPPVEAQKKFINFRNHIEGIQSSTLNSSYNLDNLFHALQQRAFSGQL